LGRQASASVQNSFIKGLITEATGLNFPENACTETTNCVFDERGRVYRRLGIDFENSTGALIAERDGAVVNSYFWKAAAGNGDNSIAVLQVGAVLYFYRIDDQIVSDDLVGAIWLPGFSPASAPSPAISECQFAAGNGYLFVSHPHLDSFYVEYTSASTIVANRISLAVRDFEGVDDGLAVDARPWGYTFTNHMYNLYNQGWNVKDIDPAHTDKFLVHAVDWWYHSKADFPSNADVWWLSKEADDEYNPQKLSPTLGNSPAPKGHFVMDPYYQDRLTLLVNAGIVRTDVVYPSPMPVVTSGFNRASTTGFFAGRVWYAGVSGQNYSNKVYFSQIIEHKRQFGLCHQQNDPTSEERFDLLPTDGGVITIQEAGTIVKLWPIDNYMLVFATNGIWGITGSEGIGFAANDYTVKKVSSIPALTESSFVDVAGFPSWWNADGIYIAAIDPTSLSVQIQSMTDETIKTFFADIPVINKRYARGYFNSRTRVIQWVYRQKPVTDLTTAYSYDRVLNFNVLAKSFYPWDISDFPVSINGIMVVEGQASRASVEPLYNNLGQWIYDNSGFALVETLAITSLALPSTTKFIVSHEYGSLHRFWFAEEKDATYKDWFSYDFKGTDFKSHLVSGYAVHGDAQRKFQPNYVYMFNETLDEDNVLDFATQANYATSGDTGKWSSTQRLFFRNDPYAFQYRKVKTRGTGVAMQFRVTSVTGEPFRLIGWSNYETQNESI
jgi:hypothetical protein